MFTADFHIFVPTTANAGILLHKMLQEATSDGRRANTPSAVLVPTDLIYTSITARDGTVDKKLHAELCGALCAPLLTWICAYTASS